MDPNFAPVAFMKSTEENNDGLIDLGLSLRTLQSPAGQSAVVRSEGLMNCEGEEMEGGARIKARRRGYVKVNMDGVAIGRKICIFHHSDYSGLAFQLEDMFALTPGGQCSLGLHLFNPTSDFSLFYKDRDDHWRPVGDVPWKEFVNRVNRLLIMRK